MSSALGWSYLTSVTASIYEILSPKYFITFVVLDLIWYYSYAAPVSGISYTTFSHCLADKIKSAFALQFYSNHHFASQHKKLKSVFFLLQKKLKLKNVISLQILD